jgi:predicted enzyme related to lactoylglutathione lyase
MQEVTKYPHGTFSWVELSTTDQEAAKAFYTELFGWGAVDLPMGEGEMYTMLQLDGRDVAALSAMRPDMQAQGIPPHWASYVTVDNVDETASKVAELGGTLMAPPFDVFDSGRMAVVQDPTGANFSLWQAGSHIGARLVNIPGALCWNELMTNDPQKASAFYTALLGWEAEYDEPMNYTSLMNNGRMAAGIFQIGEEMGQIPPNWAIYFAVADCEATAAKATELGGQIIRPAADIPGVGRFAVIKDPQGGVFNVIYLLQADPPPGA